LHARYIGLVLEEGRHGKVHVSASPSGTDLPSILDEDFVEERLLYICPARLEGERKLE
jgi:hypothetical protein